MATTRKRRRSRAELLEAQRQDVAALEKDALQEEAEAVNLAIDILEKRFVGLTLGEIATNTGIDLRQLQRALRKGGAEARTYFSIKAIGKGLDDEDWLRACRKMRWEAQRQREKMRRRRLSLRKAEGRQR
jgi:DNA-binding phage protein